MPALLFCLLLASSNFTSFNDFLEKYASAAAESHEEFLHEFIQWQQERGGFPIIEEGGKVSFVYFAQENEKTVRLLGDFRTLSFHNVYWDQNGLEMSKAGKVFYKQFQFENSARLHYKFLVDGEQKIDPLNPRAVDSGIVGIVSELAMPGYAAPPEVIERNGIAKGKLRILEEEWAKPKVTIYLPPGYDPSQKYPVIYTADGTAWIQYVKLPVILDNLIAGQLIRPVIAVMIDPAEDRRNWYLLNPDYLAYVEKVVQYMDGRYSTQAHSRGRLHIGTSAGGLATLYAGLERPNLFGNLGMLSPSFFTPPYYFEHYFTGSKKLPRDLKIWISAGSYEGYIYEDAKLFEKYFRNSGLQTKAVYTHEAHNFGTWRHVTGEMLRYFFPPR